MDIKQAQEKTIEAMEDAKYSEFKDYNITHAKYVFSVFNRIMLEAQND